jgi:glycosyltransferase involved in cell wall biosynthesis
MRIAFYAPLKPADHPTPSGDRLMANLLIQALSTAGHEVFPASRLRTFSSDPSESNYLTLRTEALSEARRLLAGWRSNDGPRPPDCWFSYHPYFRAPDWIGPAVIEELGIPYVTAEASYAAKRNDGPWRLWQADAVAGLRLAACNFIFTEQDREGLLSLDLRTGSLTMLAPFIDPPESRLITATGKGASVRLVCVAMMRSGDKLESFRMLGKALAMLLDAQWDLAVIGDGPVREEVVAALAEIPQSRIEWLGELPKDRVADWLAKCDLYVWPGTGEAYGLAYLEAQAMGLPVIAQATGGISSVVCHGETGILTPLGDVGAFAQAIRTLLADEELRKRMGTQARRFVREERNVASAARILDTGLSKIGADRSRGRT